MWLSIQWFISADLLCLPWPTQERDIYGRVHRDRVVQIFGTL